MMQYPSRQNRSRSYRNMRGFPWMLFFLIVIFTHSWVGFMIGIAVCVVLSLIMRGIFAASSSSGVPNTSPIVDQAPQPHEAPEQQYYQPYEQGYQSVSTPETYQESGKQYQYPEPQYEQPQVEYPQEMPPIQQ